jgi:hypothetical protein
MTKVEWPALARRRYLTGPAAGAAGLFQSFSNLTQQGWALVDAAALGLRGGSAESANYLRASAKLYLSCIYDGHFDLAQIGKKLMQGYASLGGPREFGGLVSETEVTALAGFYSSQLRLEPHLIFTLGS